jgi:hypothetical protein
MSTFQLPDAFLHLRYHADGTGSVAKFTNFDDSDDVVSKGETASRTLGICLIGLYLIRAPAYVVHFPFRRLEVSNYIWSIALSYDTKTGKTCGLFDGASDADIYEIQTRLQRNPTHAIHPFYILVVLLDIMVGYSATARQVQGYDLFDMERKLGIARLNSREPDGTFGKDPWKLGFEDYQYATRRFQSCYNALVYLQRRVEFNISVADFLLEHMDGIATAAPEWQRTCLRRVARRLGEDVGNLKKLSDNQLQQVLCLQKRSWSQIELVRPRLGPLPHRTKSNANQ